jgi:hypothetical protein
MASSKLPVFSTEMEMLNSNILVVPCVLLTDSISKIKLDEKTMAEIENRALVIAVGPDVKNIAVGDLVYPSIPGAKLSLTDGIAAIVDGRSISMKYKSNKYTEMEIPTQTRFGFYEVTKTSEELLLEQVTLAPNGNELRSLEKTYSLKGTQNDYMMFKHFCILAESLNKIKQAEFAKGLIK